MSPYISSPRREAYSQLRQAVKSTRIDAIGELVYLFDWLADLYMSTHIRNFENMNAVVGAFDNAKGEFRRKVLDIYEDGKEKTNGTIWGGD